MMSLYMYAERKWKYATIYVLVVFNSILCVLLITVIDYCTFDMTHFDSAATDYLLHQS